MSITEPVIHEMIYSKEACADGLFSEMIGGRILRTAASGSEGRRLCFLLGTLLDDYLRRAQPQDRLIFGPEIRRFGACNIFLTDLMTCRCDLPYLAVNLMPESSCTYSCLDKAFAYREAGAAEYWIIDLAQQFTYCFDLTGTISYRRLSFDQLLQSTSYPDFSCCISDIMLRDDGALQELAVFYRFKKEIYPDYRDDMLSDSAGALYGSDPKVYTARQFYRWIKSRKTLPDREEFAELLAGSIRPSAAPAFRHQYIQGTLYFAVRSFLQESGRKDLLCFSPLAVEMTDGGTLDSVVRPDLFLISGAQQIRDGVFKGVPSWIAEITEPGSAARIYLDKAQIYSYHGVPEYWIINDWKKQILIQRQGEKTELRSYSEEIPVQTLPGLSILPAEIF